MHIIIGSILYVTINNLNRSLYRAQRSEVVSAQRYQELQSISSSLEQQVTERTRSVQAVQVEAENVNSTLEKRMWQIAGIAHLSELMRGEQDVVTLAQNIIRGLCEYLEVPVGALFILENNILSLAGGYAYPLDDADTPNSFADDEGIVGQAVQERRTIKLSDVPADYIDITSGLGKASARNILVVPFIEENRVVGVIEIGSFTELYPHQTQFIESVLKDIGIAFSTAQARARIDELLRETQQMAEELQAQEEELRAANEELEVQTERLRESYTKLERQADEEVS
jgi:transcriptional regulator with GAF, ATPase, and Fis domain